MGITDRDGHFYLTFTLISINLYTNGEHAIMYSSVAEVLKSILDLRKDEERCELSQIYIIKYELEKK